MRPKASDRKGGGAPNPGPAEIRERIMEATLHVAGEFGYQGVTVRRVLERYEGFRAQFYKHFSCIADCYEQAYATEAERLSEMLLAAGRRHDSWQAGLESALCALSQFAVTRPMVARGLLIEVHAAGEPSLRKRREVFERLSHAIDGARRETKSRHSPPPLTAMFIIHLVDAAASDALVRDDPDRFAPTELTELISVYYDLA